MILSNKIKFFLHILEILISILKNFFIPRIKCTSTRRLDGKVIIITGGNTGIGKETAIQLSLRGGKAENAVNHIKLKNSKADITALKLDLSSLTSVRHFVKSVAQQETKIDILINNAAVLGCPELVTEDGFEMNIATNHLGHFLLTLSLMPLLKKSSNARIINVSSLGYKYAKINFQNINLRNGAYTPYDAYQQSKLANVLFTRQLAKRLGLHSNVKVYCLHPGLVNTEISRHICGPFKKIITKKILLSPELGAETTLYCALEESLDYESGQFYDDCQRIDISTNGAINDKTALRLWELSCDLVKLNNFRI